MNVVTHNLVAMNASRQLNIVTKNKQKTTEKLSSGYRINRAADGALEEVHGMLQRINELAVQAANGTNSDSDREAINEEVTHLKTERERIFTTTSFNEKKIWPDTSIDRVPVWAGTVPIQAVKITTLKS